MIKINEKEYNCKYVNTYSKSTDSNVDKLLFSDVIEFREVRDILPQVKEIVIDNNIYKGVDMISYGFIDDIIQIYFKYDKKIKNKRFEQDNI